MTKSLCVTIFFQREGDRLCICRLMTFNAYDRLTAVNIATEFQLSSKKRFAACRFIQKAYTSKKKCRDRKKNHLETNQAGSRTECGAIPPYPSHSRKSRVVPVECWLHRSIGPTVGSLDEPRFIPYILCCLPVTAAILAVVGKVCNYPSSLGRIPPLHHFFSHKNQVGLIRKMLSSGPTSFARKPQPVHTGSIT